MRIGNGAPPIVPPASVPEDGAQGTSEVSTASAAGASADCVPDESKALETNLDAQLQKAQVEHLFAAGLEAAPNAVRGGLQALKSPDVGLHAPSADTVAKLTEKLKSAVEKAGSGKEEDRAAVDQILKDIVKAYGIGQNGVTGLEFDPKSADQGDTIGSKPPKTFITVGKPGLDNPAEAASTILHESNHVRRNQELDSLGIDRDKFSMKQEGIYSALSEMEGDQLEINNAKKLGTSPGYVKGAEQLKAQYVEQLKTYGAPPELIKLAEQGKFDEAFKKFREMVKG